MNKESKLIFEAFMKNRPANYEDQLDKKEAYKSSLLRKDDMGHPEQSEASIGAALNYLASNLKSGKLYPSELYADVQDILNSLNNAVRVAEKYADSDPWEALQDLLNKLKLD